MMLARKVRRRVGADVRKDEVPGRRVDVESRKKGVRDEREGSDSCRECKAEEAGAV